MIVLALVGLLGAVAVDRSQRAAPAASPHAPGAVQTPSSAHSAPSAAAPGPPAAPRAASVVVPSATTPPRTSGRSRPGTPSPAVELLVPPRAHGRFGIRGIVSGELAPGLSAPVDLVLTNPNPFAITVGRLTARVRSIRAPGADPAHPCTARDFTVAQFSGSAWRISPASKSSLSRLGVAQDRWPRVSMPDRRVNQDGCKDASLTLDIRGAGRR
jgi:hypothetical protein